MTRLPDIHAEGERLVAETHRQADGRYLWTDVVGAVQTAIAEERARHVSFNSLTPAQAERLAMLAEEAGEVVQAVCKILRHGYESRHPDGGPTNREMLVSECADLLAVMCMMDDNGDIDRPGRALIDLAYRRKLRYTHHQGDGQ